MRALWIGLLVIAAAIGGWALLAPRSAPSGAVGVNTLVENRVTTASAGTETWRAAVIGGEVFFGDRIATAAASRLDVRLLDRSKLSVGANARLTIDRFIYDPSRNAAGALVSVLTGAFRYVSDERAPEQVSFRTPGATIGIRGTVIEGVVGPQALALIAGMTGAPDLSLDAESAAVIILRSGAADVRVADQIVVLDEPGEAVILTRKRLYSTFSVTPETSERFEALLPPSEPTDSGRPSDEARPPVATAAPGVQPPATTARPETAPPTRQPPRDSVARPRLPDTPQTRPATGGQGPSGPQRAVPGGLIGSQPAAGGQGAAPGPAQTQPQGAQQPPAGTQPGAQTPPAESAPVPEPSTKPADGPQAQPGQTQPDGAPQPRTTPQDTRPTLPSGARPAQTQPSTPPRQQPAGPGGGGAGPRRN